MVIVVLSLQSFKKISASYVNLSHVMSRLFIILTNLSELTGQLKRQAITYLAISCTECIKFMHSVLSLYIMLHSQSESVELLLLYYHTIKCDRIMGRVI